jgi:hypothetical protein
MDPMKCESVVVAAGVASVLSLGACASGVDTFATEFCQTKRSEVSRSMATVNELLASLSSGTLTSHEVDGAFETGDRLMLQANTTVVDFDDCFIDNEVASAKRYLSEHR